MSIREIRPADVPAVVALVHELAVYEREPTSCRLTVDQLRAALFGARPALFGHVAEVDGAGADGAVVGCALWFLNFSTWRGVHGLYLEDCTSSRPSAASSARPNPRPRWAGWMNRSSR